MQNVVIFATTAILAFLVSVTKSATIKPKEYPLRLQPEFDNVDVDSYLRNDRLFNFQLKCLLDEGPCDILGRFLKPRVARALLGDCPVCTPIQKVKLEKLLEEAYTNRYAVYRTLFIKYIENAGIKVDDDKKVAPVSEKDNASQKEENILEPLKTDEIPTEATIVMTTIVSE